MAANDIIDYNGFQIASGALDDPTLELLRQKGLLPQDGGMSVDNTPPAADQIQSPPVYDLLGSSRSGMMSDFRPQVANSLNQMNPEDQFVSPLLKGNSDLAKTVELPYAPDQSAAQSPISKTPMSPAKQALSPYEQIIKGTSGRLKTEANLAQSQADTYQQIASQRESMNQRLESRWAELDQARSELDKKREQAQKEFDQTKTESYWDRKGPGEKVLAALAVGLGTFASSWKGVPNIAFQMLQDDMKQDYQLQRDAVERAKGKVDSVDNDYARLLNVYKNEDLAQKAFFENRTQGLIEKLEGIKAQGVADNVKNTIDEQVGRLRLEQQKYNAEMLKNFADYQKTVADSSGLPKDIKQNEYQAATFAIRVNQAENEINQIQSSGFNPASIDVGVQELLSPERLKSENLKRYKQATANFISAVLRKESGAAISDEEFEREYPKYFALPGDSEKVQQQKARSRAAAYAGLKAEGARAIPYVQDIYEGIEGRGFGSSASNNADQKTLLMQDKQLYEHRLSQNPNDKEAKQMLDQINTILGR